MPKPATRLHLRFQKTPILPGHDQWFGRAHITALGSIDSHDGALLVSWDCQSAAQVAECADRLIRELEAIKREAASKDWHGLSGAEPAE
jgi:hypothetical protein